MSEEVKGKKNIGRWIGFVLAMLALLGLFMVAVKGLIVKDETIAEDYKGWPVEVVEAAQKVPVQSEGRVKPLQTYAAFFMLECRGDRMIKVVTEEGGEKIKIKPTAWLLDILFRPKLARELPSFRVDDSSVLESLGLDPKKRRDRFSYDQLWPIREKLNELATEYAQVEKTGLELDSGQKEILSLARKVRAFEGHLLYFSFAKMSSNPNTPAELRWSRILKEGARLQKDLMSYGKLEDVPAALRTLQELLSQHSNAALVGPAFFPPFDRKQTIDWNPAGKQLWESLTKEGCDFAVVSQDFKTLESLYVKMSLEDDADQQVKLLGQLENEIASRMTEAEKKEVKTELSYNKRKWIFSALFFCFLPALIFTCVGWLFKGGRFKAVLMTLVWVFSLIGLAMLITGTVQRMMITHRPPVGNLFETIPFITAGSVLVLLLIELFNRKKLALGMAPIVGFLGLVLARRYELGDGTDSLTPLRAVLVSNFWLTYHVLTIVMGYAAGIVAGLIGHAYIFMNLFKVGDKDSRKTLTRMCYGMVCFTLLLSLVGTILGGIWANESWGRFWGWDPKENGALMIVLWTLFILHARFAGWVREWGIHLCSVLMTAIVTFSWWGVNMLGEGLHSYGFTEGGNIVMWFYGFELLVFALGLGLSINEKAKKAKKAVVA